MDNIIIVSQALRQKRESSSSSQQHYFKREHLHGWQKRPSRWEKRRELWALRPFKFYVFYRVTGPYEIIARPGHQIKLYLTPHLLVAGTKILYPLFEEPFVAFVCVRQVEPHHEAWVSIDIAEIKFPRQKIVWQIPAKYQSRTAEILQQITLPTIKNYYLNSRLKSLQLFSEQQFSRFHLLYHPSKLYHERYGIIDQMWDARGRELELTLPPAIAEL